MWRSQYSKLSNSLLSPTVVEVKCRSFITPCLKSEVQCASVLDATSCLKYCTVFTKYHVGLWQVAVIQNRLQQWSEDVKQMEHLLEVDAQDILT